MGFDQRRCILQLRGDGICTPFIDGELLYYGFHKGKEIRSINLRTFEDKIEFRIENSECQGHISSPAVYGDEMIYHGPKKGGGGQRSFLARRLDGVWSPSNDGPVGYPYMRKDADGLWLSKHRGISYSSALGGRELAHWTGPYRHCHFHNGWTYYSQWGEQEYIKRMKGNTIEVFYKPDIDYQPTVSGPARHGGEVRDPFINDEYFACVANGEQEILVWKL